MTSLKKPGKIGVVLIQLGSPESGEPSSVRRFLREFLGDKRVLDIPFVFRFLLLHLVILPTRSRKSAKNYQSIWTTKGSPLVVHSNNLAKTIQEKLNKLYPEKFIIKLALRYGNPTIENTFDFLIQENVKSIKVLPLFPQYSSATTGSIYEKGLKILAQKINIPPFQFLPSFYDNEKYINALSYIIDDFLKKKE